MCGTRHSLDIIIIYFHVSFIFRGLISFLLFSRSSGKHACMSSSFNITILNGTCFGRSFTQFLYIYHKFQIFYPQYYSMYFINNIFFSYLQTPVMVKIQYQYF